MTLWNEIGYAALVYLVFSLFSLIGLTLITRFTKKINFMHYYIAKPLGLVLFAFPIWWLATLHVIKFRIAWISIVLFILVLLGSAYILYKRYKKAPFFDKKILKSILYAELLSIIAFVGFLYIKGFNPAIYGTERYMDILMYSGASKTDYFPFTDPWSPLEKVNYYYYGFYLFALISKIASVPLAVGYNLSLALIFVSCATLTFGLIQRISKSYLFAFIGMALVTMGGNLHYTTCYFKDAEKGIVNSCMYAEATRILYDPSYTINEFPGYSFVLGDMHPHVMAIPFFLTSLYLIYLIHKRKKFNIYLIGAFIAVYASGGMVNTWDYISLGMIFGLVMLYKLWILTKTTRQKSKVWSKAFFKSIFSTKFLKKSHKWLIGLGVAAISLPILFLPFFFHFKSPVGSIGFGPEYVLWNEPNLKQSHREANPIQKVVNYAKLFYFSNLTTRNSSEVCKDNTVLEDCKSHVEKLCDKSPSSLNCYIGKLAQKFQYPSSFTFLFGIYGLPIVISIICLNVLLIFQVKNKQIGYAMLLVFVGILLIAITELIFFGDLFHVVNPVYFRANTVFKFGYHAWILTHLAVILMLASGWKLLSKIKNLAAGIAADIGYVVLVFAYCYLMLIFGVAAVIQVFGPTYPQNTTYAKVRYDEFVENLTLEKPKKNWTLNGNHYMYRDNLADYLTVQWINKNVPERVVIIEAVDYSYTYAARIASNTGNMNLINWPTHEWTWRFHYPEGINTWKEYIERQEYYAAHPDQKIPEAEKKPFECNPGYTYPDNLDTGGKLPECRKSEVQTVYESDDLTKTQEILKKYNVKYIYIGNEERKQYPSLKEEKLLGLGEVVFSRDNSKLIKVK